MFLILYFVVLGFATLCCTDEMNCLSNLIAMLVYLGELHADHVKFSLSISHVSIFSARSDKIIRLRRGLLLELAHVCTYLPFIFRGLSTCVRTYRS